MKTGAGWIVGISGSFLGLFLSGCVSPRESAQAARCDAYSLSDVAADPISYRNKIFCGQAFVRFYSGTMRVVGRSDEEPSYDVSFLVPADGRAHLGRIDERPRRFLVRARIDPQVECFRRRTDPEDEEGCVPYRLPVYLHVLSAQSNAGSARPAAPDPASRTWQVGPP